MKKNEQQNNWVFLPVHKTRIMRELDRATMIMIDFDVTTILPKVFRRLKETKDFVYYSLPQDFKANVRKSHRNPTTRRYEHNDESVEIIKLTEYGLDKPYANVEQEIEEEVGKSVEPVEDGLPF